MTRFSEIAKNRGKLPAEPAPNPEPVETKMGRPRGKKSDKANYTQVTVYLRKDVHRTARKMLFDDGRQLSELVDDLVSRWIADNQKSGSPNV
jgi:hypothetical protein